jgi:hypothetical protein
MSYEFSQEVQRNNRGSDGGYSETTYAHTAATANQPLLEAWKFVQVFSDGFTRINLQTAVDGVVTHYWSTDPEFEATGRSYIRRNALSEVDDRPGDRSAVRFTGIED